MRATLSAANLLVGSSSAPNLHARPSSGSGGTRGIELRRTVKSHVALTPGVATHDFGHALGEHGLTWEDTIVTAVSGQALKKGVRPGWKIHTVDGTVVRSSEDIWAKFQEAKWQWRSSRVSFKTDMLAIRAEAAKSRAEKIQAEAERLARLPFEGSHDERHIAQVREEFVFQGYVDGAENRAITLEQLTRVIDWSDRHCHRWRDPKLRFKLTIKTITINQLNHWLIRPATLQKDCAFTELITNQKQPPAWFVVQWWGEKLVDLFVCLKEHSKLRKLETHTPYWISAFANRQHSWEEDFSDGVKSTAMYRAMELANFQIVLTLDDKSDWNPAATPISRLWCAFEVLLGVDRPDAELDIATSLPGGKGASVLTRALTEQEQEIEKASGTGHKQKETRERSFSLDIVERLVSVMFQRGETTDPAHRDNILNCVAGREQGQPAPEECEQYLKASKRLRSFFALSCWSRVVDTAGDDSLKDLQDAITDAIHNDVWMEKLSLDLGSSNGHPVEKLSLLLRALPPNLKKLNLSLCNMFIDDEQLKALGGALPPSLEALNMRLDDNPAITNVGLANFVANAPPKIKTQSLGLEGTGASQEFVDRAGTLDGLKQVIYEEAQKGNLCTTVNILPCKEGKGRTIYRMERSKCY